jgi:hypothetical protein
MSYNLPSTWEDIVTIGSVGRQMVRKQEDTVTIGSVGRQMVRTLGKSMIDSAEETDNQINGPHLDLFLDRIFLALEDTDKSIELMQESIDSNKKDIREMLARIKELVVDAR